MRIAQDGVICKKGRWYDGQLDGFVFKITDKINTSADITHMSAHIPLPQWLKDQGIVDKDNAIASVMLKNIKIWSNRKDKMPIVYQVGVGVDKLFMYTGFKDYEYSKQPYNMLCAQCAWTCRQQKNIRLVSCKAFKAEDLKQM